MPLDTNSAAPRRGKRTPARLQQSLEKNLLAYAAAAGAGLIVYAHPAAAQVVYTPSNISLGTPFAGGVTTNLDLNNDGTPDFKITNFSYQTQGQGGASMTIVPTQPGNEIVGAYAGTLNHRIIAQGLGAGVKIGSSAKFLTSGHDVFLANFSLGTAALPPIGSWLAVEFAYLGLKFTVNGEVHYGWARIKLVAPGSFTMGSIYGYAYESTPNQPILSGQKDGAAPVETGSAATRTFERCLQTLGVLAAGPSPAVWRSVPIAKCLPQSE